jgi:hypothetical protein
MEWTPIQIEHNGRTVEGRYMLDGQWLVVRTGTRPDKRERLGDQDALTVAKRILGQMANDGQV